MSRIHKRALKHNLLIIGMGILFVLIFIAIIGPFLVSKDSLRPDITKHLLSPNKGGQLGYGVNGINVLSWLIYGTRMSLCVAFLVTTFSLITGTFIGSIAGFFGGRLDALLMRLMDILLAFPGLLLALYLASIMPPSIFSLVFALSITGWVSYARLVRAKVLELKTRDFILAAVALGASPFRIINRHLLPNLMGPVIVQASYGLSAIILAEAGLTFLGLGLPIGTPSWGALLDQGVANLFSASYLAIFPGLFIAFTVLGFNLVGDGLRDILDPKSNLF